MKSHKNILTGTRNEPNQREDMKKTKCSGGCDPMLQGP